MSEMKMNVSQIKELMDKMAQTGLGKVSIQDGDFRMTLSAKKNIISAVSQKEDGQPMVLETVMSAPAAEQPVSAAELPSGNTVEAPIVGTFYSAPAPDKDPFVTVGKTVHKGDVLFIIESMKLMNEIQSEFDGEVAEILVKDGSPVEYGQPIMIIR
jgi:acetyl-CoA carboxylase biotin carboxyl carrier protein